MTIQNALRQMRMEMSITQTDLAQMLNKSFLTINRWENGKSFPSRGNAKAILATAKSGKVSQECFNYLKETLMPNTKRYKSASAYGFPDIDREFLFQIADSSSNLIYVIEKGTYNLLYANRKAEQSAVQFLHERGVDVSTRLLTEQTDRRCFHFFGGLSSQCPFCMLKDYEEEEDLDQIIEVSQINRVFHIHAKLVTNNQRQVYIVYLTDITGEKV